MGKNLVMNAAAFSEEVREKVPPEHFDGLRLIRPDALEEAEANMCEKELALFGNQHGHQLSELVRGLVKTGVRKVALEGAHIYGDETPTTFHRDQMKTTGLLRAHLMEKGLEVESLMFIDDFHPKEMTLNVESYVAQAAKHGWPIDRVFFESDMVPIADIMIETLRGIQKAIPSGEGIVLPGRGETHLRRPDDGQHSCSVLDAAFTVLKHSMVEAHGIINVLPKELKGQQTHTRKILRAFMGKKHLPFFNFFLVSDKDGEDSTFNNGQNVAGIPHWFK